MSDYTIQNLPELADMLQTGFPGVDGIIVDELEIIEISLS